MVGEFTLEMMLSSLIVLVYLFVTSYSILLSKKVGNFRLAKSWAMFSCAGILFGIFNVLEFLKQVKFSLLSTEFEIAANAAVLPYQISSQLIQMLAAACLVLAVWFLANSFISREEEY